jgi:ABC-2 type transport system permease protein
VGAVLVSALVSVVAAYIFAPLGPVDTSAWTFFPGALMADIAQVAGAVVGYGLIGTVLGLALRTPIPAVAVGIGWLLPLETVLTATVEESARWLPGQILSAVAVGGTADISVGTGFVTLAAYVIVGVVAATTRFVRGDVTS